MTRKSCAAGMRNAILRNHLKKERRLQNKSAFPTGLLDHVQWVDKNWRKINFRNSATLNLYPLTMVLMIKSEARMEFIQNSTFSLRKPTLNKEGSKAFSKSKASLGWLIPDLAEGMKLGQLFLQCPSDLQTKQVPLLNWVLGEKAAWRNWKGWPCKMTWKRRQRRVVN